MITLSELKAQLEKVNHRIDLCAGYPSRFDDPLVKEAEALEKQIEALELEQGVNQGLASCAAQVKNGRTVSIDQLHISTATHSLSEDISTLGLAGNMTLPVTVQGKTKPVTFHFVKVMKDEYEGEVTGWEYYSQETKFRLYVWND